MLTKTLMNTSKIARYILITSIIVIVTGIVSYKLNIHDIRLEFLVDKENSTIDVERVLLECRVIRLPFNTYKIKGSLVMGENEYRLYKLRKDTRPSFYNKQYYIYFTDKSNSSYFSGNARFLGDIFVDNNATMLIYITITDKVSGFSQTKYITCAINK